MFFNSKDTITQSGFDQLFEDGVSLMGTASLPTLRSARIRAFRHSGFHGTTENKSESARIRESFSRRYWSRQLTRPGVSSGKDSSTCKPMTIPQKGWGVFGSAGISDNNPTFLRYSLGFGIGGFAPLAYRPNDRFGIAWFYNELSNELGPIVTLLVNPQDESGVEIFYNIEVTPSFHLTPDPANT